MELDRKNITRLLLIIFVAILLFTVAQNLGAVLSVLAMILGILAPFIIGLGMALIVNVPVTFLEEKIFARMGWKESKICHRLCRPLSLLISILFILGVFSLVLLIVVPEVKRTVTVLARVLPTRAKEMLTSVEIWLQQYDFFPETITKFDVDVDWNSISKWILERFTAQGSTVVIKTLDLTSGILSTVFDLGLGFVFSVYLLAAKERLRYQGRRLCFALFDRSVAERILAIVTLSGGIFSKFVVSQCTEALILGLLCYTGMMALGMPYAITISSLVAVTAFIPIFGAFIGTFIGALMILLENPVQALVFVLFVIVLQQIEGNVIYPKVVGSSMGVPGIWVLLSVTIGGGLFGVLGMILSVPFSSVVYYLMQEFIERRLRSKGLEATGNDD